MKVMNEVFVCQKMRKEIAVKCLYTDNIVWRRKNSDA